MSKLDAVIKMLNDFLTVHREDDAEKRRRNFPSVEAAIRILEAAENVDKEKALVVYDDVCDKLYGEGWQGPEDQGIPIRALLESLPDEEKN
jgi:hypothetical protein